LRNLLEPMGCAVTEAAGGAEALDRLDEGAWDIVLLDLNMPGVHGFEVLERLRKRWPMEQLPVILVTGQDDAEARQRGIELRANEFLAKPVDRSELLVRIGGLLAFLRAQAELKTQIAELERAKAFRSFLAGPLDAGLAGPLAAAREALGRALDEADAGAKGLPARLETCRGAIEEAAAVSASAAAFARAEERGDPVRHAAVDIEALVLARVDAAKPVARWHDVVLGVGLGTKVHPASADPAILGRVVAHLLLTAATQSARGSRADAFLSADEAAGELRIDVRLAEGWTGTLDLRDGTGLGFCRRAVEAMGGRLRLEGAPGRSASICVFLPVWRGAPAAPQPGGGAEFRPGANAV
jgi:CheY-like chemotaxis protein